MGMGTAGPVPSTGVLGDVPGTLDSGIWTLSFRLYYGSDAVSFNPVPGGTPRYSWEDPFTAACSAQVSVGDDVAVVAVRVAFDGADCTVTATYDGMTVPAASPGAKLTVDATGLGPCKVGFPYTCQYLVRLEGPGGRVDVAWFSYDYATAAPTASTGLYGEMPARLTRGIWAFSFGGVLSSDVVSFVPVPGATPRMMDLLPADVDCRATVTVTDQIAVGLHVTFRGETCSVITEEAIP